MRTVPKGDFQHLLGRSHFQIERQVCRCLNAGEVIIADMSAIFAQVSGDAIAADPGDDFGRAHRVRMIAAARIADGGHVINVHAQSQTACGW